MQHTQLAVLITMIYLKQILADRRLYCHYTIFNTLTHTVRATLLVGQAG